MPNSFSPLRYPGGKTQLYTLVREILIQNNLHGETYVEPFAGGAGLALKLLINEDVKKILINDLDFAIYSIWFSILNYTEDFCNKIEEVDISVNEWENQKRIYNSKTKSIIDMGFSAFYLNRTNRSGIIKGGMIGGREQNGKYKIDARFNKKCLIDRIKKISQYKNRIIISNYDAVEFLSTGVLNHYYKTFINFDPPYVMKGSQLYQNSFSKEDHKVLSKLISKCRRKWIVTYDICPLVEELYIKYRKALIDVNYSASGKCMANEFMFFSDNLVVPNNITLL